MQTDVKMERTTESPENLTKVTPTKQNLSPKANAFSIAAILGQESKEDTSIPTELPSPARISPITPPQADTPPGLVASPGLEEGSRSCGACEPFPKSPKSEPQTDETPYTGPLPDVKCRLETKDLWDKFNELETEMIITKTGRRMFPTMRVSFTGIEPDAQYLVVMDITAMDNKRYRYAYHRSSWLVAGKADPPLPPRYCVHPDSPFTGQQLLKQTMSFEKVKLTNNMLDKNGQMILNSMHKYQPRIHIVKKGANTPNNLTSLEGEEYRTYTFTESSFIAVTAYQNQLITKLKIDSNPFAKGFRDSSRLTDIERETMESLMQNHSYMRSPMPVCNSEDGYAFREALARESAYPLGYFPGTTTTPAILTNSVGQDGRMFSPYGPILSLPQSMTAEQAMLLRNHLYKAASIQQSMAVSGLQSGHSFRYHPYANIGKLRQGDL